MEQALTKLNDNVQGVIAPNDGLANAVITALTARKLNGKVLVTGQDATDPGLTSILRGQLSDGLGERHAESSIASRSSSTRSADQTCAESWAASVRRAQRLVKAVE